jgi:hypothetical protein
MTMDAEAELPNRLSRLPWYAPNNGLGAAQPASWPRILSTENEADALRRVQSIPVYIPPMRGLSAVPPQPSGWPQVWSTEGELDLQSRLSRLPFYTSPIQAMRVGPVMGLGGVAEDLQSIISKAPELLSKVVEIVNKAGPHLDVVMSIVSDPAMPQIVARIRTIQSIRAAKSPPAPAPAPAPATSATSATAPTATPPAANLGLKRALPILDGVIFFEKHPWAPWAIGAGVLLVLGGIGFGIGRLSKRCKAPSAFGDDDDFETERDPEDTKRRRIMTAFEQCYPESPDVPGYKIFVDDVYKSRGEWMVMDSEGGLYPAKQYLRECDSPVAQSVAASLGRRRKRRVAQQPRRYRRRR